MEQQKKDFTSKDTLIFLIESDLAKIFPRSLAERHQILPLFQENGCLTIGLCRPHDIMARDIIKGYYSNFKKFSYHPLTQDEFLSCLSKLYDKEKTIKNLFQNTQTLDALENYTAEIVDRLLSEAINKNASDIHLVPEPHFVRIYYRIDGLHRFHFSFHLNHWERFCVRLKWLANLNIAQRLVPQSGKASFSLGGRTTECRISTHPTQWGESITIRFLDLFKGAPNLEALGFDPDTLSLLKSVTQKPEGLVVVTGPTGSGKTTTLYGLLNEHLIAQQSVATLEQPIECFLPGSRQTEILDKGPLDFAGGIRSLLRHDPDVILVGEVRDDETAKATIRAAMTGHHVYSTLHIGDSFMVPQRFADLGGTLNDLLPSLTHIINQRLIPAICPLCKKGMNCLHCNDYGYLGRLPIAEVIVIDDDFRELFQEGLPLKMMRYHQKRLGLPSLWDQGQRLIELKKTTENQVRSILGTERSSL